MSTNEVLDYDVSGTSEMPEYPQYETEYIDSPCNQYLAEVDNNETSKNQNSEFKTSKVKKKSEKCIHNWIAKSPKVQKSRNQIFEISRNPEFNSPKIPKNPTLEYIEIAGIRKSKKCQNSIIQNI